MLKVVGFAVCLALFCSSSAVSCTDFDADNCGLYFCAENAAGLCVEDPCYTGNDQATATSCNDVTNPEGPGNLECRLVHYDYYNRTGAITADGWKSFCVQADTHFTDCKLTNPQAFLTGGASINPTTIATMESYCKNIKCGGLQWIEDTAGTNAYFYCDEPGTDGAVQPNDFDVANCKNPEYYINTTNQCDFDECLDTDPDSTPCPAGCTERTLGGQKFCYNSGRTATFCALSYNEIPPISCASQGCGQLNVAKSLSGKPYYYCGEPGTPPASPLPASQFTADNCKNPKFLVNDDGDCVDDVCVVAASCTGGCTSTGSHCFKTGRTVTDCELTFSENPPDCAAEGCGALLVVRSNSGIPYFYCGEKPVEPKKCGATSLHIPVLASLLVIAAFMFF